jgi:hypothetical protein
VWSPNTDKDGAPLCCRGAAASQISSHCIANIGSQGQTLDPIAFASDDELAGAPIDVVEAERADLASAQAETDEQHQHGEVPSARARPSVAGRQELLNFRRFERLR